MATQMVRTMLSAADLHDSATAAFILRPGTGAIIMTPTITTTGTGVFMTPSGLGTVTTGIVLTTIMAITVGVIRLTIGMVATTDGIVPIATIMHMAAVISIVA